MSNKILKSLNDNVEREFFINLVEQGYIKEAFCFVINHKKVSNELKWWITLNCVKQILNKRSKGE